MVSRGASAPARAGRGEELSSRGHRVAESSLAGSSVAHRRVRDGTRERVGHERRAVHERHRHLGVRTPRGTLRDLIGGERRAHGHVSARERLADAHDVRRDPCVLACKESARPAKPGRDAVEDEQYAVLVAQLAHAAQVVGGVEVHAAGSLYDRLEDDCRDLVRMRAQKRGQVSDVGIAAWLPE